MMAKPLLLPCPPPRQPRILLAVSYTRLVALATDRRTRLMRDLAGRPWAATHCQHPPASAPRWTAPRTPCPVNTLPSGAAEAAATAADAGCRRGMRNFAQFARLTGGNSVTIRSTGLETKADLLQGKRTRMASNRSHICICCASSMTVRGLAATARRTILVRKCAKRHFECAAESWAIQKCQARSNPRCLNTSSSTLVSLVLKRCRKAALSAAEDDQTQHNNQPMNHNANLVR